MSSESQKLPVNADSNLWAIRKMSGICLEQLSIEIQPGQLTCHTERQVRDCTIHVERKAAAECLSLKRSVEVA